MNWVVPSARNFTASKIYFVGYLYSIFMWVLGDDVFDPQKGSDLSVVKKGQTRAALIAEVGEPIEAYEKNGQQYEVFELVQSNGRSVGRAVSHLAGKALTNGVWEVFAAPLEAADSANVRFIVRYDEEGLVDVVKSDRRNLEKYKKKEKD